MKKALVHEYISHRSQMKEKTVAMLIWSFFLYRDLKKKRSKKERKYSYMYMICSKTTKSDMHKADLVLHDFHDWSNLSVVSGHEKAMANEKSMVKGERSHHWWKQSQRADGKTNLVIVFGHGRPEAENRIMLETKALSN